MSSSLGKLVHEFIHKLTMVVVASRVHLARELRHDQDSSSTRRQHTQAQRRLFNLLVPEYAEIRDLTQQYLVRSLSGSSVVSASSSMSSMSTWLQTSHSITLDIMLSAASLPRHILLERWTVHFESAQESSGSSTKTESRSAMSKLYKHLIILLRSIVSYSRLLPAFRLFRAKKDLLEREEDAPFEMYFELHGNDQQQTSSSTMPLFDASPESFCFKPMPTSLGTLRVSCFYRRDCSFDFAATKPTSINRHIIQDHFNEQATAPAPPQSRRWSVSSPQAPNNHNHKPSNTPAKRIQQPVRQKRSHTVDSPEYLRVMQQMARARGAGADVSTSQQQEQPIPQQQQSPQFGPTSPHFSVVSSSGYSPQSHHRRDSLLSEWAQSPPHSTRNILRRPSDTLNTPTNRQLGFSTSPSSTTVPVAIPGASPSHSPPLAPRNDYSRSPSFGSHESRQGAHFMESYLRGMRVSQSAPVSSPLMAMATHTPNNRKLPPRQPASVNSNNNSHHHHHPGRRASFGRSRSGSTGSVGSQEQLHSTRTSPLWTPESPFEVPHGHGAGVGQQHAGTLPPPMSLPPSTMLNPVQEILGFAAAVPTSVSSTPGRRQSIMQMNPGQVTNLTSRTRSSRTSSADSSSSKRASPAHSPNIMAAIPPPNTLVGFPALSLPPADNTQHHHQEYDHRDHHHHHDDSAQQSSLPLVVPTKLVAESKSHPPKPPDNHSSQRSLTPQTIASSPPFASHYSGGQPPSPTPLALDGSMPVLSIGPQTGKQHMSRSAQIDLTTQSVPNESPPFAVPPTHSSGALGTSSTSSSSQSHSTSSTKVPAVDTSPSLEPAFATDSFMDKEGLAGSFVRKCQTAPLPPMCFSSETNEIRTTSLREVLDHLDQLEHRAKQLFESQPPNAPT